MVARPETTQDQIITLSPEEARQAFDAEARRSLGMSGDEFIARWQAGAFPDPEDPNVVWVASLLFLVDRAGSGA